MQYDFYGKTVEDATKEGLEELGLNEEDVKITVLDEGKKKLFGAGKAHILIETGKESAESAENKGEPLHEEIRETDGKTDGERAVEFLQGLVDILHLDAEVSLKSESDKIRIDVNGKRNSALIGKRGMVLDAVQTLAGAVANIGRDDYKRVVVDCENYRENREETLKKLAENLAAKATRLQRKIKLEPMNPYERRILHAALSESEDVTTTSDGKEPNRYVVIVPNNDLYPDEEPMPARGERSERGGRRNGSHGERGGKKPYNQGRKPYNQGRSRSSSSGKSMSPSSDFFGTFLGNSNKEE